MSDIETGCEAAPDGWRCRVTVTDERGSSAHEVTVSADDATRLAAAIDAGEVDDLASLATSLGWFDHAHFSRDFRAVVGMPPSAYLARARAEVVPA